MQHARPNRLRRAIAYAALAALLGLTALTVSQCTMTGERLTGVSTEWGRPTSCLQKCTAVYNLLVSLENKRHTAALKKCKGKASCISAENALHAQKLAAIEAAKTACQNQCHSQGGGHH